jgi:hypothetical protein
MRLDFFLTFAEFATTSCSTFNTDNSPTDWAVLSSYTTTNSTNTDFHQITVTLILITNLYIYQPF